MKMNSLHQLKKIAETLNWDSSKIQFKTDQMGATNTSCLCIYHDRCYVFRLGSKCSDVLSINRSAEKAALKVVSENGWGAPLVYYDVDTGNMVTEYLSGREMSRKDFENPDLLDQAVKLMQQLHQQKIPYLRDIYEDVEKKLEIIRKKNIPLHPNFAEAYQCYKQIVKQYPLQPNLYRGLCHGDMFANNFLLTEDERVVLLDYEYAGMGDIFYDLACFSSGWNVAEKEHLLQLYFGECKPEQIKKLTDFSVISWMWNGTWAYLKSCEVSQEQFDYVDFGHRHIEAILKYKHTNL